MNPWPEIAARISAATGVPFAPGAPRAVGGGCINDSALLSAGERAYFVKLNRAALLPMFEAEAAGLEILAATATLRVPRPLLTGTVGGQAFLVMEALDLGGSGARGGAARAGQLLAALHRTTRPEYGWERDNFIGATPQINTPDRDWVAFWRTRRLGFQLALAARNGYGGRLQERGERLLAALDQVLDHHPPASLLHGDLWGGNLGYDRSGQPVIFDPAVYFGDREADLAMTELFGGFGADFYAAYREAWPLAPEYAVRKWLYNLYHVLNHLNLFGGGYLRQAENLIERVLAEV